jgi:dihydroorotate dehydrogenase electron transfer subunit
VRTVEGRITKIFLEPAGGVSAWIECAPGVIPGPGRFCLVNAPADKEAVLPVVVFSGEDSKTGFLAVGDLPAHWFPGTVLRLRGPLGKGFRLPEGARRLALGVCGETARRLMPLRTLAARQGADIAWFTDAVLPVMPAGDEVNPLRALPEALEWADFLVLDFPLAQLAMLRSLLGLQVKRFTDHLPVPGQALILTEMPCAGVAECGACAVSMRRGRKLACQDGPVFDLESLAW